MEANKCPNCGASINNEIDRVTTCTYCGGTIINQAAKVEEPVPTKPQPSSSYSSNSTDHPGSFVKLKFKGIVFVLLLVFAWPLAFLYLAICKIQEKEDQKRK